MVRFKHRYLLVNLIFPATIPSTLCPSASPLPIAPFYNESSLISLLRDSLSVNFGDIGAGEVGGSFAIKYLSTVTAVVIIRVSRDHVRTLWQALSLLRKVGGMECIARVLHVSGTIRKTQHAAIALDREIILKSAARINQVNMVATEGEETELETSLRKSEEVIMDIEA